LRETVTVQLDRYISGQVETSRYTSVNKVTTTEFADDNGDIIVVETTTYRTQINYSDIVTTVYETTTTIEYNDGSTETHTTQYSEDQLVPADPVVTYHSVETDRYYKETETPIEVPTSPEIVEYASVEYSDPNLGTPTPDVKTPAEYRASSEFWATAAATDDHLAEIKVDAAWSRGWTGKGSVVAVADSGAMVTHSDLDAQITATKNFITGLTDVTDNVGHGTHVAGTIAAEMNNQGMVGVAPDAKLMIAKVTDNTGYSFSLAKQATKWASDAGAVAINMSASSMFDNSFKLSLTKHSTGMFSSNHWYYGTNGYNGYVSEAGTWKPYIGNEIVMVVAAGNDGLDYAAFPGLMATAVDDNGNLILDGRMIIAGAWDTANQKIANYSNKAGHVCLAWNEGTQSCDDLYKIKDFYLMAPGSTVYSTMPNGSYNHMSGTSMAAPHITGAVAIIHQMWPHMTGRNLVQLLLVTGDKSFAGYDENIHGQGLLDMDRATQPVGATGIPKTGRTSGGVTELSGGIAGSVELGEVASNVMVLDSFERDFYVDLGQAKIDKDTRTVSFTESLANDTITNSFASLAGAVYQVNDMIFALGEKSFAVGKQYGNFEIGYVSEDETVLNNEFAGMFGVGQTSETVYAAYTRSDILAGFNVDTKAEIGYTTSSTTDNSLITSTSGITSVALHGAVTRPLGDYWVAGATASMPRKILDGSMGLTVPVARTLDGRVLFEDRTMDLSKGNTEFDVGVVAKYRKNNSKFSAYLEHRFNQYGSDTNGTEVRVNYELNF
jgi:Subtilisin-like serine proteases